MFRTVLVASIACASFAEESVKACRGQACVQNGGDAQALLQMHADPDGAKAAQLLTELKEVQEKVQLLPGKSPPMPAGITVTGSLEPLLEPLAEQTWKVAENVWATAKSEPVAPPFLESLDDVIKAINNGIEFYVKDRYSELQARLLAGKSRIAELGEMVKSAKLSADKQDQNLLDCRRHEVNLLTNSVGELSSLVHQRAEKDRICAEKEQAKYFHWHVRPDIEMDGKCDNEVLGDKKCEFNNLFVNVNNITQLYQAARERYFVLHDACASAMEALDQRVDSQDVHVAQSWSTAEFIEKKDECSVTETRSSIAMCTFGDRLQEKCDAVAQIEDTVALTRSTGPLQKIFRASQSLKNAFMAWKVAIGERRFAFQPADRVPGGSPLIENAGIIDFAKDIGAFESVDDDIAKFTSGDYFACEDGPISFAGKKIVTGVSADKYYMVTHSPEVKVRPLGSYSFDFCTPYFQYTTTTMTRTTTTPAPPENLTEENVTTRPPAFP